MPSPCPPPCPVDWATESACAARVVLSVLLFVLQLVAKTETKARISKPRRLVLGFMLSLAKGDLPGVDALFLLVVKNELFMLVECSDH